MTILGLQHRRGGLKRNNLSFEHHDLAIDASLAIVLGTGDKEPKCLVVLEEEAVVVGADGAT